MSRRGGIVGMRPGGINTHTRYVISPTMNPVEETLVNSYFAIISYQA
jgi:hypothetical protein